MSFDGTGFGHYPFGHFPFGHLDYGLDTVTRSFPDEYFVPEQQPGQVQYLTHYLATVANMANQTKQNIDNLDNQIDFTQVRQDLLPFLGSTIGAIVDDAEPANFQRSLVGNSIMLAQIKATANAYSVRGKISGFSVDVFNLWGIDPIYVPFFNSVDVFEIPVGSGMYFVDLPPGSVSGTPTEESCEYCLSALIRVQFTLIGAQPPQEGGESYYDRLISKLQAIIPIHVRQVLFEFIIVIVVDEHDNLAVDLALEDTLYLPVPMFPRFDAFPGDFIVPDGHGTVAGSTSLT